jgi:hypothetical protein
MITGMKRISVFLTLALIAAVNVQTDAAAASGFEAENATISQGVVESNHTGFTGTGFVNYDNVAGSYVQFSVTGNGGTATLTFRFANGTTTDRPMDILVNGVNVANDLSFSGTGTWDTWQTRTVTTTLTAGSNTVRAVSVTANGGPNLDSLSADFPPPVLQAENATINQGVVESNHLGFTGTGFVNYDNVSGSYVLFAVTASAGPSILTFRYSNGATASRPMSITVNGTAVNANLAFGTTADWDTWTTASVTATLNAGANTVRATATTANGGPNLDSLTVKAGFQHPGVLVSRAQLDVVKAKVAAGAQPWKGAYDAMVASSFASLSYTAHPRAIVECGPSSNPNFGCSDERDDAIAAYTHALRWYLTGDNRYADKAIQIMDAWSAVITDHTNSNAPLQTGWAGASWSRAAELIKHTYTGWPQSRVDRFGAMLRNVYLPEIINGSPNTNGNWELVMTETIMGIGVFLDDRAVFDKAVSLWRGRVPAYVYLTTDGSMPKPPPNSSINTPAEIIDYWQGQSTFVDGLAQETCRDFGHTGWGLESSVHVAEIAWHQGLDLYAEMRTRMTKALEFHANYDLGATAPSWLCGGTLDRGLGPTLEIGYNHYANRLGIALPKTKQEIETLLRPTGADHFLAWETLTHANNP